MTAAGWPSDAALDAAAQVLADGRAARDALTPRKAAEAAFVPGGMSVDQIEQLIRQQRDEARAEAAARTAGRSA